jgi:hypothetical protein
MFGGALGAYEVLSKTLRIKIPFDSTVGPEAFPVRSSPLAQNAVERRLAMPRVRLSGPIFFTALLERRYAAPGPQSQSRDACQHAEVSA